MNTQLSSRPILAAALGAMLLSGVAYAEKGGSMADLIREAKAGRERPDDGSTQAPRQRAPQQSAPRRVEPPRANDRGDRNNRGAREDGRGSQRFSRSVPPANNAAPAPAPSGTVVQRRGDRGTLGNVIERNFERGDRGGREYSGGRGNGGNYAGNRRPPRYVSSLPGGYRHYDWGGRSYYNHGGRWYRPYGNRYLVVGAPFGLFVNYLPSHYNSFWYGNSRYFYADDTYYTYEPVRRGYVVSRSPYGDDYEDEYSNSAEQDEELYVYPARGQSEQQQADDRYECHRWAVDQTSYDPIDSEYDAEQREDYLRAMTACLTGRGYSVK